MPSTTRAAKTTAKYKYALWVADLRLMATQV
jgi:hypothetical protein